MVFLSLGLDPDSLEHRGDFIAAESFPDAETQDEFRKRIDLLSELSEKNYAPLSQFVGMLGKLSMPPALAVLAVSVAPDKPPSSAAQLETRRKTNDEPQGVGVGDTAQEEPQAGEESVSDRDPSLHAQP